jgi:beta-phosphoglucomutase
MNEIKNKIKAVIFDMDGTIIQTEHIWRKVSVQVLMEQCNITELLEHHEIFLQTLSGMGLRNSAKSMKDTFNLATPAEEIMKRKVELADNLFDHTLEFIGGFETFHKQLQSHIIPTSIATNADHANLQQIARSLNFERFFGKNMYCVADVGFKAKPDPALFLHAAKQLGVKPEECIVFEDSIYGFQAAQAAGMKCIAIKNNFNNQHLSLVNHAIDDYSQAEDALKKLILP